VKIQPGERIEGLYRGPVELTSGRFALIERSRDFTLVPWRPGTRAQPREDGRGRGEGRDDLLDRRPAGAGDFMIHPRGQYR